MLLQILHTVNPFLAVEKSPFTFLDSCKGSFLHSVMKHSFLSCSYCCEILNIFKYIIYIYTYHIYIYICVCVCVCLYLQLYVYINILCKYVMCIYIYIYVNMYVYILYYARVYGMCMRAPREGALSIVTSLLPLANPWVTLLHPSWQYFGEL